MAGPSGKVTKKPAASKSKPKSSASTSGSASATSSYAGKAKGVTQLPVARVKRIIKEDKDISMVSNDAVFLISMATVRFPQHDVCWDSRISQGERQNDG